MDDNSLGGHAMISLPFAPATYPTPYGQAMTMTIGGKVYGYIMPPAPISSARAILAGVISK